MSLFSKTALCAAFGVLLFGCGDTKPNSDGYTPVEDNIPVFSDDLVVRPMELGKPISNSQIRTAPSLKRMVAKSKKPLFQIDTQGREAMKIVGLEQDLSSCDVSNINGKAFNEAVVNLQEEVINGELTTYNTLKEFSVADLNEGAIVVSLKEKGVDTKLVASIDLLAANCETLDLKLMFSLPVLIEEEASETETVLLEDIEFEEVISFVEDSTQPEVYEVNSAIAFGIDGVQNNFLKVFRLSPELTGCEGMTPSDVQEATTNIRTNLIVLGANNSREFLVADVANLYESIDYSEHDRVHLELDNIPAKCSGVLVTTSHWLGAEKLSPEPARTCSLEKDSTDPMVAWFPKLNALPLVNTTEDLLIDVRGLCNSAGILDPSAYQVEGVNYLDLKTAGDDGNKALDVYNLMVNNEVVGEVSCAGPNRIRFNHDPNKLFCSDKLADITEIVGVPVEDEEEEGGDNETPENEGAE